MRSAARTRRIDLRKKAHTEEQIIDALENYQSDEKRRPPTFAGSWGSVRRRSTSNRQYAALGVQQLRELRQLREKNGRLKRIVADLSLDGRSCRRSSQKSLCNLVSDAVWRGGLKRRTAFRSAEPAAWREFPGARCAIATAEGCRSAARTAARAGGYARSIWLSKIDGAVAPRGLGSECETHLSAV